MGVATGVRALARTRNHGGERPGAGRPKSDRDDISVKMDRKVVAKLQYLAKLEGVSLAEYLTELARPIADRLFEKATRAADRE